MRLVHRRGLRHPQPRAVLGRREWTRTLLKTKYGDRLTFWGGGVDTQKTLPFGTPAEVRAAGARALRKCSSQGGGFVFNTDAQHPGRHAGGEHRGDGRGRPRIQRHVPAKGELMSDLSKLL